MIRPRSFVATMFLVAAIAVPLAAIASAVVTGSSIQASLFDGVVFGLVLGAGMATRLKGVVSEQQVGDRAGFIQLVREIAPRIGYLSERESEDLLVFKPSFRVGAIAGKLAVEVGESTARVVGPKKYVEKFEQRLTAARQTLED